MAQEDVLTLAARVKDESSGVVAAMGKAWQAFNESVKKGHTEGVKGAKEHGKEVTDLREKFKDMRREVIEGVTPALAELGLGFFSVGGAIETVIGTLKTAADQFNVFRDASARAHASVDFLQSMSATMSHLTGESAEQATQNLANFGEQLDRITRGRADTLNGLSNLYSGLKETLGESLKGKSVPEALETLMKWKDAHPEIAIDKVRDVFRYLGIEVRLATVPLKEFDEIREKNERSWREHPFDMEAAHRLDDAIHSLTGTVAEFNRDMVHAFGADGADLISMFVAGIKRNVDDVKQIIADWRNFIDTIGRNLGFRDDSPEQQKFDEEQKKFKYIPPSAAPGSAPLVPPGGVFPGGAYHRTAFTGSSESESLLTRSIHAGTLAALQDWYAVLSGKHDGITPASYGPSGSAGGGRGWGGGGYSVLDGGGKPMPGGADNNAGGGGDASSLPQGSLQGINRDWAKAEMAADPELRETLRRIVMAENPNPTAMNAVVESAMNRAQKDHITLRQALQTGAPFNRGAYYPHLGASPTGRLRGQIDKAIDDALGGSDVSHGATDNSSSWLAEKNRRTGAFQDTLQSHGESFEIPGGTGLRGGRAAYDRWRAMVEAQIKSAQPQLTERSLLEHAARTGFAGAHKVEGDAHLKVDLNGFPKGTRTDLTYGGLFTRYTLSKGQQMQEAEHN